MRYSKAGPMRFSSRPSPTSSSYGSLTRRSRPWARRSWRRRPSWRTARRWQKGCRGGRRVRSPPGEPTLLARTVLSARKGWWRSSGRWQREGPVAALPNPGLPQLVDGHIRFQRNVDHFAEYGVKLAEAGARLVGGCCGTTPAHVSALSRALREFRVEGTGARRRVDVVERAWRTEVPAEPVSEFAERLRTGFAVTVEVDLPRGNAIAQVVEAARRLKERGVHAIDISDGARARLRMHPVAAARIVQDEAGIEVVAHISCRDRNIIGLQADLLGAAALGV